MLSSWWNVPDFLLVENTGNGESEEEFVVLSGRGASELDVRRISGASALLEALRGLAPRRIILDFHVSFGRGLDLLRALKIGAPEPTLVARVRSWRSRELELPLFLGRGADVESEPSSDETGRALRRVDRSRRSSERRRRPVGPTRVLNR